METEDISRFLKVVLIVFLSFFVCFLYICSFLPKESGERRFEQVKLTSLHKDNALYLAFLEALSIDGIVPHSSNRSALKYPQQSKDHVGQHQEHQRSLQRPDQILFARDPQKEETDGDFGPHEGGKRLDPFAVGVLFEFLELMRGEVVLVSAEAVVHFHKIQGHAYCCSKLRERGGVNFCCFCCCCVGSASVGVAGSYNREQHGVVIPSKAFHDPCSSGKSQPCHNAGGRGGYNGQYEYPLREIGIAIGWRC